MKNYYYILLIIIMSLLIIVFINPEYGDPRNLDYINYYLENGVQDTGAINLVASIYLNYRTYDTLIETVVLFMAVMGITLFLGKKEL
jgi:multicomponent Na+:H+ antiporter subunit B